LTEFGNREVWAIEAVLYHFISFWVTEYFIYTCGTCHRLHGNLLYTGWAKNGQFL